MKFSVCCITPSRVFLLFVCLLPSFATCAPIKAQDAKTQSDAVQAGVSPLAEIAAANSIEGKDKRPFHLKMSFQLFTLEGKPSEQGTLEEWWSFNSGARLNVTTPTLGTIHSLRIDQSSQDAGRRSIFLIEDMVTSTTRPAGTLNRRSEVTAKDQSVGSVLLHCLATKPGANSFSVCTGEADKTIRVVAQPNRILIRNRIGKLNDAEVALDEKISYCGRDAITGHVEALESFAPTSDDVETQTPVTVPGQVLAGMKLSGDPPLYPVSARMNHISGVVFLGGYINELGKIDYVFPIASPSPMLTGAALTAIKQWTYRPYLLNGKPVGVNTVITTNFNLSIR